MTLPSANLTEVQPTGQIAKQAPADVAVYLGVSSAGPMTATPFGAQNLAGIQATYVNGPLCAEGGYMASKTPVQSVFYRLPVASIAATHSTAVFTGTGTASSFVIGGTIADGWDIVISVTTGGTIGTSFSYKISLDGGQSFGAIQSAGASTTLTLTTGTYNGTVVSTAITLTLTSTQTLVTGDTIAFWTQPASASILTTTLTRVASSTSTQTFSGTPNDGYEIVIIYQTGGTVGVAGITLIYSLDGGLNFSPATVLPLNGVFAIPDKAGASGVTLTAGAGTIDALDKVVANTTPPAYAFADVQTAMNTIRSMDITWSFFVLTGYSTRAMRDSVESLLQTYATNGRFTWAACPARDRITGETATSPNNTSGDLAWSGRVRAEWATSAGNRTPPMAGSSRVTCPMSGRQNRRPDTLGQIPRIIGISPDTDPGDRTLPNDGALSSDIILHNPATGALVEHDARLNTSLFDLGFNVYRTWYGEEGLEPGVFPAGGRLMSASGDIQRWQHRRVLNLADGAVLTAMKKFVLSKFAPNPPTVRSPLTAGDIAPWTLNNLTDQLFIALLSAVGPFVSNPRQGGIVVTVTPTPSVSGGNTVVNQTTQLVWKDYIDTFSGTIGFVNPIFAALTQPPS